MAEPSGNDQRPTPDPTILTTEQILREVENATKLLEAEIGGIKALSLEKFGSVSTQFTLIERQRVEQKADTEKAVQAALSAAKEAVKEQTQASDKSIQKSETAMTEQLKQLSATFTTSVGGVTDILGDLKERMGKIESVKQGAAETREQQSVTMGQVTAAVGVAVALFGVIAAIAVALAT